MSGLSDPDQSHHPHAHRPQHGSHGHGAHDHGGPLRTAAHATIHCLVGCAVGELAGLAIGVAAGLGVVTTIVLATGLAYVAGFGLALVPIMQREGLDLMGALRVAWLGEAVSIAVMEIVMNVVDYLAGGMAAMSLADPVFWTAFLISLPPAFLLTWPVNYWLLKKELKAPH